METASGPVSETPVSDDVTPSNPITVGPIPVAPGDSAPTTIPAVGPAVDTGPHDPLDDPRHGLRLHPQRAAGDGQLPRDG